MIKAFAYMRCSGDGQSDGDTWERQRQAIQKYADLHDILIVEEFLDDGIPGKTELENRPGLASLMAAVQTNGVRMVLVEIADRLARDLVVNELIVREFQKLGCTVISASGGVDLTAGSDSNPTAKLIRQILAAVAEFDRCVIVLRTRAARERLRAKNGKCEGRHAYGAKPGEENTLGLIDGWANEGLSPAAIARLLNNRDIKTRYGATWNRGTVWKIINRKTTDPKTTN